MDFESITSANSANPAKGNRRSLNDAYIISQKNKSARGFFTFFYFLFFLILLYTAFALFRPFRQTDASAPSRRDEPPVPIPTKKAQEKKNPRRNPKSRRGLVPDPGVEPGRPCGQWILNPSRLPIPPIRRKEINPKPSLPINVFILPLFPQNATPFFKFFPFFSPTPRSQLRAAFPFSLFFPSFLFFLPSFLVYALLFYFFLQFNATPLALFRRDR